MHVKQHEYILNPSDLNYETSYSIANLVYRVQCFIEIWIMMH